MKKTLFIEFIESQRKQDKDRGYAVMDDEALLYRFLNDCNCWEILNDRRQKGA